MEPLNVFPSVILSGSSITFPAMRFMDFGPVQDVIGRLGDMWDIEGITNVIDGAMKIVGLQIEEDAPAEFVQHIYTIVKAVIEKTK